MKLKPVQHTPLCIALGIIALVCCLRWWQPGPLESAEARTYDWRVRLATNHPAPVATNLGFVAISDESIVRLKDGSLRDGGTTFDYGLYRPRHVYGRVLRELAAQGAVAVGFDVLFGGLRPDHSPILVDTNGNAGLETFATRLHTNPKDWPVLLDHQINVESDDFFAWQLYRTSIGIIASERAAPPHPVFRDHAAAIGDITAERDADGVLRRVCAFKLYRFWHPLFRQAAEEYKLNLDQARLEPGQVILFASDPQADPPEFKVPLAADGTFDPMDFGGAAAAHLPRAKPFTDQRVWHLGILLAARQLQLDLDHAAVDLPGGRITLRGPAGLQRIIPVDANGFFLVDWQLPVGDPRLTVEAIETLLARDIARTHGLTEDLEDVWHGKLVVVGSTATGNDLTDLGATPLEKETVLMSKHWNVANTIITDHFIRRTSFAQDCLVTLLLGALAAGLTLRFRVLPALAAVLAAMALYTAFTVLIYIQYRLWLPLFLPLVGAMLGENVGLVTWRVVFEQKEKRRVRSVFAKIVAPEVVHELLAAENVALGGTRRELTVFFADVRGFTAFTDISSAHAAQVARDKNLSGAAAEEHFDREATETLDTVNAYLALVADKVKQHGGTLDKYIGDCVMAFWNAPTPFPSHALACIRAAIDTQRAIDDLNRRRAETNARRELENQQRAAAGQPPVPLLPILSLGTGINTGQVIVGLMGSDDHILNYTVFGREVNLASRLEALSGRGRILIGETTFAALQRDDPPLAAICTALAPVNIKGIREVVNVYEVPWRISGTVSPIGDDYGSAAPSVTSFFVKPPNP